jgi:hypothetical protein
MRKHLSIKRWDIEFSTGARRAWTDFKVFRLGGDRVGRHYVWGRLSLIIEDATVEAYPTCAECGSDEVGEVSCGDEGWTVCQACQSVEQGYIYLSKRRFEQRF